ncbi:MAG TPA: RidA family protein [Candidatus Eremiobacteraceae bacterium]|nr:RidA family protein [Candidatus Eremiobacteraceae bacterium]
MTRRSVLSGAQWESLYGYSRAVRVGDTITVAGTTSTGGDAYEQAKGALAIIDKALRELGGSLRDVVRTRIFVVDMAHSDLVGRAHGEVFGDIKPAATMVEVRKLIRDDLLVEIEADAIVQGNM